VLVLFCFSAAGQEYDQEKPDPDILFVRNIETILKADSLSVQIKEELEKTAIYFHALDSLTTLEESETDSVKLELLYAMIDSLSIVSEDNILLLQELQSNLSDALEESELTEDDLMEFSQGYRLMSLQMSLLGLDLLGKVTMQEQTKSGSAPGRAINRDDNSAKPEKDDLFKILSEKAKAESKGAESQPDKKITADLNNNTLARAADYLKAEKLLLAGGKLLKKEDIASLDDQDLENLKMTILAAKGKIFKDTVNQEFFAAKKWYKPGEDSVYSL
jgi:hypothetical protein